MAQPSSGAHCAQDYLPNKWELSCCSPRGLLYISTKSIQRQHYLRLTAGGLQPTGITVARPRSHTGNLRQSWEMKQELPRHGHITRDRTVSKLERSNPHLYSFQTASRPAQKLQEWHRLCIAYTDTGNKTCLFIGITASFLKEHISSWNAGCLTQFPSTCCVFLENLLPMAVQPVLLPSRVGLLGTAALAQPRGPAYCCLPLVGPFSPALSSGTLVPFSFALALSPPRSFWVWHKRRDNGESGS